MQGANKVRNFTVIALAPTNLTLYAFNDDRKKDRLVLHGHERIAYINHEINSLVITNPTAIDAAVQNFITAHSLQKSYSIISLSGPSCPAQLIVHPQKDPSLDQLVAQEDRNNYYWNLNHLYSDDNDHLFHICALKKELILHYLLLAYRCSLNLITITNQQLPLFLLYQILYANAFRPSQLVADIQNNQNQIDRLFSREMIYRFTQLAIDKKLSKSEEIDLLAAIATVMHERNQ